MKRLFALVAAVCCALTSAPALARSADDESAEAGNDAAEQRKILVMLKMPAQHYRPNARYSGTYDDAAAQAARRRVAAGIARQNDLELLDGWAMPLIGVDCYVMRVPGDRPIEAVIARISRNRMVAWSQPLQDYHALAAPRPDPLFAAQPAANEWQLAKLHSRATGKGVKIAVIDSKIEASHPDLAGQVISNQDFLARSSPPESHGTGVAGIIAAKAGNGLGIAGVAPGARLLGLRACSERAGSSSTCDSLSLARALQFAIENGAEVINMSLSGPPDRLLAALIAVGLQRGASVVAAFDAKLPSGGFPASLPGVIAVADEALPSVPQPVFRAPGRQIPTTQPGGRWYLVNGSSFAAAHVAGLVALLREERREPPSPRSIARASNGTVDACATLAPVTSNCNCSCAIGKAIVRR